MNTKQLIIFTRTPLHVGIGSSVGAVDLPIRRERHTNHPIIPGSSIKVPVRSAKGAFAYVTCPFILRRFARESNLTDISELTDPADQSCLAGSKAVITHTSPHRVVLEEYAFSVEDSFPKDWEKQLLALSDDPVWQEAAKRLVLLSDGDFAHFVTTTTEISTQTKIDPETGAVAKGALFNMECVPAETLFSAPVQIVGRYKERDSSKELVSLASQFPVLQFGGNSTTGRGFCSVSLR